MDISSAAYDSISSTNLDNFTNPLRLPGDDGIMGIVDASDAPLRISTHTESVEVLPGKRGEVWAYRIEREGKIYVNPTIGVQTGANFCAELANGLDEETTIHWHGQHVEWRMDGYLLLPMGPGAIDFSHGFEGARLYMFHCHILEHESAGMMLNVEVVSGEA